MTTTLSLPITVGRSRMSIAIFNVNSLKSSDSVKQFKYYKNIGLKAKHFTNSKINKM